MRRFFLQKKAFHTEANPICLMTNFLEKVVGVSNPREELKKLVVVEISFLSFEKKGPASHLITT